MNDPFTDVADELMMRSTDLGAEEALPPLSPSGAKTKKHVCPYCGAVTAVIEKPTGPCPRCNMEDTPATRAATKARIGPWYVLQTRNPSAPGMKWATLLSLVSRGQVTPRSVVRGPTTHQLWKFAAHVKGLSREFNLCYSCGGEIERTANQCPHCDRLQEPPVNPDTLLESREMPSRGPVQREIKSLPPAPAPTDMVIAGGHGDELARKRSPDDGILSAKELAAAFQLDFNPQSPTSIVPSGPRPRRRPLRALATLILIAAIAGGALLYLKPDYREKTVAWVNSTFASIRNSINTSKPAPKSMPWENSPTAKSTETEVAPAPAPAPAPSVETSPAPAPAPTSVADTSNTNNTTNATANDATATTTTPPPDNTTPPPAPAPAPTEQVQTPPTTPEPSPASVTEAPQPSPAPAPAPTPAVVVPDPTPTPPPVVAEKPAPTPAAPPTPSPAAQARQVQEKLLTDLDAPIPASVAAQKDLGKRLFDGAIDAERPPTLDFTLAARCYEKIGQLDPDARPINPRALKTRLEFARNNIPKN